LPDDLRFDDVLVDFRRYEARKGAVAIELTRKEFGLLRMMAARTGEVVTREQLLDEVWGYDFTPTTRTIDNHVASLRAKLEADPGHPRHLQTVFGVGYKWLP
jgi:DNA-binding response OmpR family regulator